MSTSSARRKQVRRASQVLVCRAVLSQFLQGEQLEQALEALKKEMRVGEHAWCFKPADVEPVDDRIYYEAGGDSP